MEELKEILESLDFTEADLEDIEVLCGCTGMVCQSAMLY